MEPTYSRDECVTAIRDYYAFLVSMFMDPNYIIEPPQNGWPEITTEVMHGLGKTEEVINLLRHLPYIEDRNFATTPEGLPGGIFIDWRKIAQEFKDEKSHPGNELVVSEGDEYQFLGKIPAYCIGLVHGGMLLGRSKPSYIIGGVDPDLPDVILLDTKFGLIHWMNCPAKIMETASPRSSRLVYPIFDEPTTREDESDIAESTESEDEIDSGNTENQENDDTDDEYDQEDEDEDDDEDEELVWGPCWPVREFFEMLKNQFRELYFVPKDAFHVVDVWSNVKEWEEDTPKEFVETLQANFLQYGWPDVGRYRKQQCMEEMGKILEKYPKHYLYYQRGMS